MSYVLSFSEQPDEIWTLANRHTDWFIEELTKDLSDTRLKEFIIASTYYQGLGFNPGMDQQKNLIVAFLNHLQKRLPDIIDKSIIFENRALTTHLKKLQELVNNHIPFN